MNKIADTHLILNADGSLYHLNLLPEDVADIVITVGDPDRVNQVSRYFDHIELKKGKREFITHTGIIGRQRISVISTGIGTDNIDIVMNELDALVNIDLSERTPYPQLKSLDIIRIGTSGALQPEIPVDSLLISSAAFGMDSLMHYYVQETTKEAQQLLNNFSAIFPSGYKIDPYITSASALLLDRFSDLAESGITLTAPGFYSPQGRKLRVEPAVPDLLTLIRSFDAQGRKISNLEMETAGIYGMASCLGHKAISFNVILANRATDQFSKDPQKVMDLFIEKILEKIC